MIFGFAASKKVAPRRLKCDIPKLTNTGTGADPGARFTEINYLYSIIRARARSFGDRTTGAVPLKCDARRIVAYR